MRAQITTLTARAPQATLSAGGSIQSLRLSRTDLQNIATGNAAMSVSS
jgi:hypothetical protein